MKKWERFSEEELKEIYENSANYSDFFTKIGYKSRNSYMSKELENKYEWFRPKNLENLMGQKFGRLLVIQQLESNNHKRIWLCLCDCGNKTEKSTSALKSGHSQSCGCLHKEMLEQKQLIDLTNKEFGSWKVINRDRTKNHKHKVFWNCKCLNCGTLRSVDGASLRSGISTSCGCQKSRGEAFIKEFLKTHFIDYIDQYHCQKLKGINNKTLYFDFFLPKFNICIEYQGIQHYMPIEYFGGENRFITQQQNDEIKRNFCKNNNIKLLEFSYKDTKEDIIHKLVTELRQG